MAVLVLLALVFATIGGSDSTWCVCRSDVSDSALQKTLDYACGSGADCSAVLQSGGCFQPNTVRAHCSYAVNSYFQKKGQAAGVCDFAGTATISTTDPGYSGCSYPSTASSGMPMTTTSSGTPTSTTPPMLTPSNSTGSGFGLGLGLGPSGATLSPDGSGCSSFLKAGMFSISISVLLSAFLSLLVAL